jgi:hypothetical protein
MRVYRVLLVGLCGLMAATPGLAGSKPLAVSPGDAEKLVSIADPCPTFNWGAVDGASSYELVVYRLGEGGEEAQPVLQQSFAGSVTGWTPSLERCLKRSGSYAWSVRAVGGRETSDWSRPSLFAIVSGVSEGEFLEALAIVRRYTDARLSPSWQTRQGPAIKPESLPSARFEERSGALLADSGTSSLVAYGDSCCNGNLPSNYAAELGNNHDLDDPDVLALVISEKNQPAGSVNYIGFFHKEELGSDPELIGEIEGDAGGGLHFTGSASISGWVRVPNTVECYPGPGGCTVDASCPGGTRVLGGGYAGSPDAVIIYNGPNDPSTAWQVQAVTGYGFSLQAYAICAEVGY